MKILHTADWHAGRSLHGVNRTPEIRAVLQEIAALAIEEQVDLVLVAGDLYDNKNPSAEAEEAVYEFFLTTGRAGIPSVAIAGNHDASSRLDAVGGLLKLVNVRALGEARVAGQGGSFEMRFGDEVAQIAALPFVSERRIVKVLELLEGDAGRWRERYQAGMRGLIQNLTKLFSADTVNLLVMHTTMNGATLSNSEYKFHCTENYSLSPDIFPEGVSYVALGHIHKPQSVEGFPEYAARYVGSPLQLDFGEQGDTKYVDIVEARAGRPTELVKRHEIKAGKKLRRVKLGREGLDGRLFELEAFEGWLKIVLELSQPEPGLKDRVKAALPHALTVELKLPEAELPRLGGVDLEKVELAEAYAQFYRETRAGELPGELREAFSTLYKDVHEAEGGEAAAVGETAASAASAAPADMVSDVVTEGAA